MAKPRKRGRVRRRRTQRDWVQLAAIFLTAVTAIAGCVEKLL